MPSFTDSKPSPYSTRQLFEMVADVEKYPEFLPWCRAARILSRKENEFEGELLIHFKGMNEKYTSRVQLTPPANDSDTGEIHVSLVSGPFEYLTNHWKFEPRAEGGSIINFHVDFKFKSRLLEAMIGGVFTKASEKMVGAFLERAEKLFG